MELVFHGHACVSLVAADGRRVVMDPYRPGAFGGKLSHAPVRAAADVVTVSHYHVDHCHVTADLAPSGGGRPQLVDRSARAAGVDFRARFTYHDLAHGTRMGMSAMMAFELDGLRIAHLGDIGCELSAADVAFLGPVDVLIWPVGGVYTLGPQDAPAVLAALSPRLALPVHYDNARCQLGMAPIEALGPELATAPERPGRSGWSSADGLPQAPTVCILEPAC